MPPEQVLSPELARHLAAVSRELRRQIGVFIGRDGAIRNVFVGTAQRLELPDVGRLRGGSGRFRGLRLVRTSLRGAEVTPDDLNDLALLRLDLVAVLEVLEDGEPGAIDVAHLVPATSAAVDGAPSEPFARLRARDIHRLDLDFAATMQSLEEETARVERGAPGEVKKERALVIGVQPDEARFEETLELARSANVTVAATVRQKRREIHPRSVVGRGKLEEIVLEGMRRHADVAIFDIDLKPAQARVFEDETGLKAIDRTQLILDIFAQRARSREGKLQVELAQLKYALPRLTERDAGLSRLAGGIGGRGPGETVMEIGRRRIRDRIRSLETRLGQVSKEREVRRKRRRRTGLPVLSIVGYTNAGKSTLLNALTNSDIEAADKLFMTLDPTSRRLRFPEEGEVIVTDTVGFIADLPEDLVKAFSATLEEAADADLLLHVVDVADEELEAKIAAVESILRDLHADELPVLMVFNKADLLPPGEAVRIARLRGGVAVSARTRHGLGELVDEAARRLREKGIRARPESHLDGDDDA